VPLHEVEQKHEELLGVFLSADRKTAAYQRQSPHQILRAHCTFLRRKQLLNHGRELTKHAPHVRRAVSPGNKKQEENMPTGSRDIARPAPVKNLTCTTAYGVEENVKKHPKEQGTV
jgi:hypothetical protein